MEYILKNLKSLKKDMQDKGWIIDSFNFNFKKQNYIVLVKLLEGDRNAPKYALIKLEFLKEHDFSDALEVYANSIKLLIDAKTLRKFFSITYSQNLGEILDQFTRHLSTFIPLKVLSSKTDSEKSAMCNSLDKSDSEDPRKKYCFSVRRNPVKENGELGQRSPYNDNKTRIYRPHLYRLLGDDQNLSFRYSMNPDDCETDENIIAKWNESKNIK